MLTYGVNCVGMFQLLAPMTPPTASDGTGPGTNDSPGAGVANNWSAAMVAAPTTPLCPLAEHT